MNKLDYQLEAYKIKHNQMKYLHFGITKLSARNKILFLGALFMLTVLSAYLRTNGEMLSAFEMGKLVGAQFRLILWKVIAIHLLYRFVKHIHQYFTTNLSNQS